VIDVIDDSTTSAERGKTVRRRSRMEPALKWAGERGVIATKARARELMENFIDVGVVNAKSGHFETSLEFLEQSVDIARGMADLDGESRACFHLGCLYNAMGQYDDGKAMHERSSRLSEQEQHIDFECELARHDDNLWA